MLENDSPTIPPSLSPSDGPADASAAASPAPSAEPVQAAPSAPSTLSSAFSWVRDLAFSVLLAVVLIVFIYQPVKVAVSYTHLTLPTILRV